MSTTFATSIVPQWFLRYLWLSGLVYPAEHMACKRKRDTPSLQSAMKFVQTPAGKAYSYVIALLTTTMAILSQIDYFGFYWKDIATLDFFVLVRLINNNATLYQVPVIFIVLISSRQAAANFRTSLYETVPAVFTQTEVEKIRRSCSRFSFIFISIIMCITTAALIDRQWAKLGTTNSVIMGYRNVSGSIGLLFAFLTVPACVNVDVASQMCGVIFIVILASGFDKVRRDTEGAYCSVVPDRELALVIRKATVQLQKLRSLTSDFNEAFGLLVLLQSVRDLIAVVSFIALMLRYDGRLMDESLEQFKVRSASLSRTNRWDYCSLSITLTHAILRISACLSCCKAVKKITGLLQKIGTNVREKHVQSACSNMLSGTDASTGTISAGGFALINMEYVAGVLSALVAYSVLVYQARDTKVAAQDLALVKTVRFETEKLKTFIQNYMGNFSRV